MQIIKKISITVSDYIKQDYYKKIQAPDYCPNCDGASRLHVHGEYKRWVTDEQGKSVWEIFVRRFLCQFCGVTISCLPDFAHPYRLINMVVIQSYFDLISKGGYYDGRTDYLLKDYRKQFGNFSPEIYAVLKALIGKVSKHSDVPTLWKLLRNTVGEAKVILSTLLERFAITLFGRYRCHQKTGKKGRRL